MKIWKVFDFLDKLIEIFIILATATLVITCFFAVVFRYLLGNSLFWADEFMRYLFVSATMIGSSLLVIRKGHIMVDFTQMLFGPKMRRAVAFICYSAITLFGAYLMIISFKLVEMGATQTSSAMVIKMSYVYLCFPIGLGMTAINGIRLLVREFYPTNSRQED